MKKDQRIKIEKAFWSGDWEALKTAIAEAYDTRKDSMEKILKEVNVSRSTYYESISAKGNPSAKTLLKILKGLT